VRITLTEAHFKFSTCRSHFCTRRAVSNYGLGIHVSQALWVADGIAFYSETESGGVVGVGLTYYSRKVIRKTNLAGVV